MVAFQQCRAASGDGHTFWTQRPRLVLLGFLVALAVSSQITFVSLITPANQTACQVTSSISATFDQVARIVLGGFLIWVLGSLEETSKQRYFLWAAIGVRASTGVVFVALARPQFVPACVLENELASSIAVIIADVVIIIAAVSRCVTFGHFLKARNADHGFVQKRSRCLIMLVLGFALWFAVRLVLEKKLSQG